VTVHFECFDDDSGVAFCSPDVVLRNEGRNQSVTGTATDNAGNSASFTVDGINIDKTPPTTAINMPPTSRPGWYSDDVTIDLDATDPLLADGTEGSGVQFTEYRLNGVDPWLKYDETKKIVVTDESLHHVLEYRSTDNADNVEQIKREEFILLKHVLFAGDGNCRATKQLEVSGSHGDYGGKLHANGHLFIGGSSNVFDNTLTGACGAGVRGRHNVFASPPSPSNPKPVPPNYTFNDFPCDMTFNRDTELGDVREVWLNNDPLTGQLKPGVYCSTRNLTLRPSYVTGEVTLVALGQVKIRGSHMNLLPRHKYILAFSGSTSSSAFDLWGSHINWEGIVLATNGKALLTGSHSVSDAAAIIAARIDAAGSETDMALPR
jgi:hypothetical protein